jgi:prepilin-type N-terminal cleavage/methylation domain-containing protein
MKKGYSLLELVVAMGIFAILTTLVIGAYVSIINIRTLANTMRESQQKLRVASETITRLARQADTVLITGGGRTGPTVELFFGYPATSAVKFSVESGSIFYYDRCLSLGPATCNIWPGSGVDMLGGSVRLIAATSFFTKTSDQIVPKLQVQLDGTINFVADFYNNDTFRILTEVPLENLR